MPTEIRSGRRTQPFPNSLMTSTSSTCRTTLKAQMEGAGWVCMWRMHPTDPTDLMLSVMEVTRRSLMEQICSTSLGLKVNLAKRTCSSHKPMKKKRIKKKGKRRR